MKPLSDITVIDLTHMLSGPYAGMVLADMGARTIKVEPPIKGELTRGLLSKDPKNSLNGMGAYFLTLNRNKESVCIDLKDNKCVRLTKGKDYTSKIFNTNPTDQAKYFEDQGCSRLHLVDLDSAFGRNDINNKTINKIREAISIPIQLGGGIRNKQIAEKYFELGINYLIIGSYAVKNLYKILY